MNKAIQTSKQLSGNTSRNLRVTSSQNQRIELYTKYSKKLTINPDLTSSIVSFQTNKKIPLYRWFKYKEAFSSEFVHYILDRFKTTTKTPLRVLDPFAGVGTTLTTASKLGCEATGIELLPVGVASIRARFLAHEVKFRSFQYHFNRLRGFALDLSSSNGYKFPHLRITEMAFSKETEDALSAYATFLDGIKNKETRYLFWFACLSVLFALLNFQVSQIFFREIPFL
jgi:hypothetical protein